MKEEKWIQSIIIIISILVPMLSGFGWVFHKFGEIENRLTKIETVLIIQKIMPQELCHSASSSSTSEQFLSNKSD